jgi:hypothetical protein
VVRHGMENFALAIRIFLGKKMWRNGEQYYLYQLSYQLRKINEFSFLL